LPNATPVLTLSAQQLTRSFGNQTVIHDVSLQLKRGEVLGLLGHNGAGKSTTMQMLTGCLTPDSGTIEVCGIDLLRHPTQAKAHIGYLPETPPLYKEMTVGDYLTFVARLHGLNADAVPAALDLALQRCGLNDKRNKLIGTLSRGYQQRLGIAQAIIHQPAVAILDEPTVGLDPTQIREIRTLIRELGNQHSVILSTHLLSEVESICDRVEIMQNGRLIYGDTSARMQRYGQISGFTISLRNPPALSALQGMLGVTRVEQVNAHEFRVLHSVEQNPSAELLTLATQHDWQLEQLTPLQTRLEDVFVKITNAQTSNEEGTK
jgi:ABC-2 type transport system ATP-binding protein